MFYSHAPVHYYLKGLLNSLKKWFYICYYYYYYYTCTISDVYRYVFKHANGFKKKKQILNLKLKTPNLFNVSNLFLKTLNF